MFGCYLILPTFCFVDQLLLKHLLVSPGPLTSIIFIEKKDMQPLSSMLYSQSTKVLNVQASVYPEGHWLEVQIYMTIFFAGQQTLNLRCITV